VRIHRRNICSKLRIGSQGELFMAFINTLGAEWARHDPAAEPVDSRPSDPPGD
jgi:hypothetical protein